MGADPLAWIWFVFTQVVPYLLRESVKMMAAAANEHPAGAVLAVLVALGIWQLMEVGMWFVRKTWVVLVAAAVALTALGIMGRL